MKVLLDLRCLQTFQSGKINQTFILELSKRIIAKFKNSIILWSDLNPEKALKYKKELDKINSDINHEIFFMEDVRIGGDFNSKDLERTYLLELLYEWKMSQLDPDVVMIFSFFDKENPSSIGKLKVQYKNYVFIEEDILNLNISDFLLKRKMEELNKASAIFVVNEERGKVLCEQGKISDERIKILPEGCSRESFLKKAGELIIETLSEEK